MPDINDAKNMKQLGEAAYALMTSSLATYYQLSSRAWQVATGEIPLDNDQAAKDVTTLWGTVARDMANAAVVLQKAATIAATPPPPPTP